MGGGGGDLVGGGGGDLVGGGGGGGDLNNSGGGGEIVGDGGDDINSGGGGDLREKCGLFVCMQFGLLGHKETCTISSTQKGYSA